MVERGTQQFGPVEVTRYMTRPPLSKAQHEVLQAALKIHSKTKEKVPQVLIAANLDKNPKAINLHVRKIFEKGYDIPVVNRRYTPRISQDNAERMKVLRTRRTILEKVTLLRLKNNLQQREIYEELKKDFPEISQGTVYWFLQSLREKNIIPRIQKRRTEKEKQSDFTEILSLLEKNFSDRQIANRTGRSLSSILYDLTLMRERGMIKSRRGKRPNPETYLTKK